jgi:peptide/nickel transport system substrate-binding protein
MNLKLGMVLLISLVLLNASVLPALSAVEPAIGGTLVMGLVSEPTVLDSASGSWNVAPFAGALLNSLMETDEKMQTVPGLAESWSVDSAKKAYIFQLRKGVKWHDGKPFTAEDVKFTFEELLPKYDNRGEYLQGTKVEIRSETEIAIIPGDFAPGIHMPSLASVDWPIFPKHILQGQDFLKSDYRKAPVGTGPYKFKEWVKGSHIILERNENYWRPGKPYVNQIIVKFIPDSAVLLASLIKGEVDYVYRGLPYEAYDTMKKSADLQVFVDYKPNYKVFVVSNLKHPVLSNRLVRKAIVHAINKTDIVSKATVGLSRASDRTWAPEFVAENPNLVVYPYNPKKAEELLDTAGYPKKSDGKRFAIELLVRIGEADETKTADLLKDYLKAVGIDVTIKSADFTTVLQLEADYKFDICINKRWILPIFSYQNHHSSFIIKGRTLVNIAQYSNPDADRAYEGWRFGATEQDRTAALLRVESIITDDLPEIPLFDVAWMYVWNKRIKNAFVPSRNWLQCESLENIYIDVKTPLTTTKTTVAPPTEPAPPYLTYAVIIVVLAILGLALFRISKSKRKT